MFSTCTLRLTGVFMALQLKDLVEEVVDDHSRMTSMQVENEGSAGFSLDKRL